MKKKLAVLLIVVMVMALAACGKKEEPSSSGNTEATKAAEPTKEAEPTKAAEVTKEAEPTKAEDTTKEAEPTKAAEATKEPEVTPEATPTPIVVTPDPEEDTDEPEEDTDEDESDEFYSAGHAYDGIYVSDQCTLFVDAEGAADIFQIYFGRNDNRDEWDEWYEFWTNYSEEDQTFTAVGGYHKYADPDKAPEYDEDTVTFVVSGEKIIYHHQFGDMEFICANEGDFMGGEDSERSVDALGNETWVMEVDKSGLEADILGYSEFLDYNYLVTLNYYDQYKLSYEELAGKNIGDEVELNDGNKAVVYGFFTQAANGDFAVKNDTYTDDCRVVVLYENPENVFTQIQLENMGYYSDPESVNFGFVLNNNDGMFYGYNDWSWDDCYVRERYVVYPMVKLVVSPETVVESAYNHDEDGNSLIFSGAAYLSLRENPEEQEAWGVFIPDSISVYVTEVMDASGRSTGEIERIKEIYSP